MFSSMPADSLSYSHVRRLLSVRRNHIEQVEPYQPKKFTTSILGLIPPYDGTLHSTSVKLMENMQVLSTNSAQEPEEDLEDGEIFDDDDDPVPAPTPDPPAPPKESIATIVEQMQKMQQQMAAAGMKRRGSPLDRGRPRMTRSKRPKRSRDDERPPFGMRKRRRSEDEKSKDEEDEEGSGRDSSPPNHRDWDRFRSEDEDDELGFNDGPGGRGMGMRRGRRDFGRPRRGGRGGRGGGRRSSRRDGGLCKFFLQGTCQRGNDCPFSHTIYPRKYEMCKFYMNDCCVKKDKCNYMHEDFPCKFWHLGLKCYSGKRCKFSHQKVTPYIKQMLIKQNPVESDKHFLHNLQTTDSRSPTPPDYSDYEAPSANSNYVIVSSKKRGANGDDITVDDIELTSDHEPAEEAPKKKKSRRDERRHSDRRERHSRDDHEDHRDHKDHREHRDRDHRRERDRDHERDRDRDHRDRHHRDKDKEKEKEKDRESNHSYEGRHSDEEDGRTPMPSPSNHSSDRDGDMDGRAERSNTPPHPPKGSSHRERKQRSRTRSRTRTPSPPPPAKEPKGSVQSNSAAPPATEDPPVDSNPEVPLNLPKKQMELYLRIQQQQQQREAQKKEKSDEDKEKEDYDKEDDWYSSDEEGGGSGGGGPLATILNKIKAQPSKTEQEVPIVSIPNVSALPDFDISAVTRLLSSVRETIEQQKNNAQVPKAANVAELEPHDEKKNESPKSDDKRRRDPRLTRADMSPPHVAVPMKLPPLDIDLRLPSGTSDIRQMTGDVDLRQLPFKPVPVHQAAREIDASTTSNPPIPWVLTKFPLPPKPDYSHVQPKNALDPRLRRYTTGGSMSSLPPQISQLQVGGGGFSVPQFNQVLNPQPTIPGPSQSIMPNMGTLQPAMANMGPPTVRDPRQRALVNDPRRKNQLPSMPQQPLPPQQFQQNQFGPGRLPMSGPPMGSGPPGMPMYPIRGDSDLRNPNLGFHQNDVDLRFQQSAPHHHYP